MCVRRHQLGVVHHINGIWILPGELANKNAEKSFQVFANGGTLYCAGPNKVIAPGELTEVM